MKIDNRTVVAGIGVRSSIGESQADFARVLYQETPLKFGAAYFCSASDMADVAVDALKDAGVASDAAISIWICGELPYHDLYANLKNHTYSLRTIKVSPTFSQGLEQASLSLTSGQTAVGLVIAKDDLGIGALVLVRDCDVLSGDIYAVIESINLYGSHQTSKICDDTIAQAGISPEEIGYFEATVPELPDWVLDAYRDAGYDLTCAWGGLAGDFTVSNPEHQKCTTAGICSLIKTIYALYRRTLPAFPSWEMTGESIRWRHTPFYTIQQARPWFVEPGKLKRFAAWLDTCDGLITHMILSEPRTERTVSPVISMLGEKTVWLLPVTGQDHQHLQQNLWKVKTRIDNGESLQTIQFDLINQYKEHSQAAYALSVVGRDREEVLREVELAIGGVDKAFASGKPYRTPRGSAFTSVPQSNGDIAFVYPGAFNSYVGFGRELLQHFPILHERLSVLISNVGRSLAERRLYPRSLGRLSTEEKQAWSVRLTHNPIAMIESGTTFAIAYSMIMREVFHVHPQSAMGYSLGEISMLWSAGVWNTGDAGSDAWHASPLFKTRLFGPKQAVREAWDIQPADDNFWSTYLIKAPEEKVRALVSLEPRVYLTIVNLPAEVVIAGDDEGCQRIIRTLSCHAVKMPFDSVIHNEIVRSEYDTFVKLYTHPIQHKPGMVFYSAAGYAPLELSSDSLAHAIADMTCKPVHLPRLVNTVYEGGTRIFIELGPQATCTRWINRILRDKPHVAVPVNRTGMGDFHGVISVIAQLITNRINVNLQPLLLDNQRDSPRKVFLQRDVDVLPEPALICTEDKIHQAELVQAIADEGTALVSSRSNNGSMQLNSLARSYVQYVLPQRQQITQNHQVFLQARHNAQQQAGSLIEMQLELAGKMLSNYHGKHTYASDASLNQITFQHSSLPIHNLRLHEQAMFSRSHLVEFASGDVERCFGEDYAVYRGRRLPRIPNGDLLLMDRVISIDGKRGIFNSEPELVSEYDVPADAWYFIADSVATMPPYAVLMEIALQPCGFLSAYLGSTLSTPHIDYYFRNLDGHGELLCDYPVKGKTIRNTVKLISSISLRGIIMQRYQFDLQCDGTGIYRGEATFGYFTKDALSDQGGLDNGEIVAPHIVNHRSGMNELLVKTKDQLHGLDRCSFDPDGGTYGKGYVYGEAKIDPGAWFFKCHFYQDPVMPGSLGIHLMYQALELSLCSMEKPNGRSDFVTRSRFLSYDTEHTLSWRYRGQVKPGNKHLSIELHIVELKQDGRGIIATAEGSLWVDRLRIYNVSGLTLCLR